MAASTIAVNLSGVTGNVYAQAGMNTVYTNVPQNDTVNILVGSEVAAIQLTNPYYTTDTTTGFHVLQNIEVQDSYANYKVWSYYGNVTLTNKLTGQVIQFQLTKPLPGANNSGVNVEFLDGTLAYTANVSANGNWTTWITKGDTGTSTWGTNSVASPFTAATALDQTLLGSSGTNTVNQAINSSDVNDWYGIEPSWFISEYYLFSKQAELAAQGVSMTIPELEAAITEAGFTPYTHYLAFSTEELTDPNEYFSTQQVLEAQAAVTGLTVAEVQAEFEAAGFTNAYDWWAQYGWTNGINPSNDFNDEAYLEAKAMASGLTIAEVQQAFIDAGLTPLAHYLEFGQAEGLEATPVYLDEQVEWQYTTALGTTAGQVVVGSEVSEQFTAIASPLARTNTLHATDTIDGQGGINTLTVDLQQSFAGFSAGKGLTNVQNVQLINADGIARNWTATGSTGVENYALAGEVNVLSQASIANVVAQDRTTALNLTYTTAATAGTADQLNLTTIDVANAGAAVNVAAAGIETLQLDTHGVNILNLSGVANATELVVLGDGVTEIAAVGAAVKAVDAAYASGDLTVNLSGATGVTSVVTGTGENHIQADLTANSGQLAKNAVITGNGTLYDELLLTNVTGSGTTTVQYTMTGVEGLAFGNINGSTVQYSAKNTTGLEHVEIQSAFTSGSFANVVNLGAVDIDVQLQGTSGGMVTIDNLGATLVTTEASTAAISTATAETNNTAVTLNNATVLDVYVDAFTALGGSITANKAAVVDIEIDGAVSNVITAAAATGATILQNNKTVSSTLDLVAAAATSLEVISAGTLTLSSGFTDLGKLQTLNVDTAESFTLYKDIAAANSVTLSGAGDVTLMNVGATTNGYSLTVDAAGLNGTLTTGALSAGDGYNLTLNLATLGGEANLSATGGALTATTGIVSIDASSALAVINVGDINAKEVQIDAGGSLGSFQAGLISASSSVIYIGTELFGSTADITATGSILTVDFTGGLANDEVDIAVGTGVATKSIVVTGAMDLATTNNYLEIDASPSTVTAGVTITYSSLTGYEIASVVGSSGADTITAGDGNDVIRGRDGADIIYGSLGADEIYGNEGNDQLYGEFGDDSLNGGQGDDTVWGGDGNDYILGGSSGNDLLYGNNGDDFVDGDVGSDTIFGGSGNDTIKGGEDADQLSGGGGANEFFYGPLGAISLQTGITIVTADHITDFNGSRGDRIDTDLTGTSLNYAEAANVADFSTALTAANSAFSADGNLYYYLTSSTSDGGLLFIDNGAAIGADAVIVLSGISSANFEYTFII